MATEMKKRKKQSSKGSELRRAIDTCAKTNDLAGALTIYDAAVVAGESCRLSAYHYNSILHVLSSSIETLTDDSNPSKQSAIDSAFKIFDSMVAASAVPNEATITSMARVASQRADGTGGDLAFEFVVTMGEKFGASPKLRTYGPALMAFCRELNAEKAYAVEEHMTSNGVVPEELEIAALLEVSAKVGRDDKVYQYLHKLRSNVDCVTGSTAEILEKWFGSEWAIEVGSLNWDVGRVKDAILKNGGGWHGLGWMGKGCWQVKRSKVNVEGVCSCCSLSLDCVDIDKEKTESFAESVARFALQRESRSNFQKFQEWLDNNAEYEAIIDGANVALYQQNFTEGGFSLSQLNTVVQEFLKRNQNKWPLIVLHNRRIPSLMENPNTRQLLETWKSVGALYTTPTGSNDDWYWLYAAVKLKCLLVTNDEMRDHIFELLGTTFFPKWKERHQVRYTFVKGKLSLMMPPPYSTVIQESETGTWHVPLDEKCNDEQSRTWFCVSRQLDKSPIEKELTAHSLSAQSELGISVENVNCKQLSSLQPCNNNTGSVTGKRRERE